MSTLKSFYPYKLLLFLLIRNDANFLIFQKVCEALIIYDWKRAHQQKTPETLVKTQRANSYCWQPET